MTPRKGFHLRFTMLRKSTQYNTTQHNTSTYRSTAEHLYSNFTKFNSVQPWTNLDCCTISVYIKYCTALLKVGGLKTRKQKPTLLCCCCLLPGDRFSREMNETSREMTSFRYFRKSRALCADSCDHTLLWIKKIWFPSRLFLDHNIAFLTAVIGRLPGVHRTSYIFSSDIEAKLHFSGVLSRYGNFRKSK